ncbi:hypothetical protein [Kribbella sp. NPDC006257]
MPLLHIVPSKNDAERLIPMTPERARGSAMLPLIDGQDDTR